MQAHKCDNRMQLNAGMSIVAKSSREAQGTNGAQADGGQDFKVMYLYRGYMSVKPYEVFNFLSQPVVATRTIALLLRDRRVQVGPSRGALECQ
jgi:hypothetical protein